MLKPYMHGYFISLKLYDAARVIANPFAYAEHREKMIRERMDKMAETRIRTKKDAKVKVNKALADKILKEEERARKREEKKKQKKAAEEGDQDMDVDADAKDEEPSGPATLLNDPRFAKVFEDPEFAIDENSREYALLNPSTVAQKRSGAKTAVEDEEEERDKSSSDGLGESGSGSESEDESESDSGSDDGGSFSELFLMLSQLISSSRITSAFES